MSKFICATYEFNTYRILFWNVAENIIEILLENGASVEARNRKKQTPVNCSHSMKAARLLMKVAERATQDHHPYYIKVGVQVRPSA